MTDLVLDLLTELHITPVLLDIGASGQPPPLWRRIAAASTYIGFDLDARDLSEKQGHGFQSTRIVNQAVTATADQSDVTFYLTKSPHCSSTLQPDLPALSDYLFADLFEVERQAQARATTLDEVAARLGLKSIDWFKTDSQGTDLRLFQSLSPALRSTVLAIDLEPGLIHAYRGEDLLVDAHRELLANGFWLSDLNVAGTVRMQRANLPAALAMRPGLDQKKIMAAVKRSPGWGEMRYLRTLASLQQSGADQRQYALLWVFALLDGQFGFAFDVGVACARHFGDDQIAQRLQRGALDQLQRAYIRNSITKLPGRIWRRLRRWLPVANSQVLV